MHSVGLGPPRDDRSLSRSESGLCGVSPRPPISVLHNQPAKPRRRLAQQIAAMKRQRHGEEARGFTPGGKFSSQASIHRLITGAATCLSDWTGPDSENY